MLSGPALGRVRAGLSREVFNSLSVGLDTAGGFLVGQSFAKSLEVALLSPSGILRACSEVTSATGEPLSYPICIDSSVEGSLLPEGGQAAESDPSFGSITLNSYLYSSGVVRCQVQLLRDSSVDAAAVIGRLLGERLGRALNHVCTDGDGAAKPKGILTSATLGVTAASATALNADETLELIHSVDAAYRQLNATFMTADEVFLAISLLKDGNGSFLLSPLGDSPTMRLRGYEVAVNQHMPATIEASAKVIVFGRLESYLVRQVGRLTIQRLVERWADYAPVGFLGLMSFDAVLLDAGTHPLKFLPMHS